MPNKKNIFDFFSYIQTMINILIIFITQYFQGKKGDLMVRVSSFNQWVQSLILFSKKLFLPWMKSKKKIDLGNFFKLNVWRKKLSLGKMRQSGNPNHVPPRSNFPREKRSNFFGRRRPSYLGEQFPSRKTSWMFEKKI